MNRSQRPVFATTQWSLIARAAGETAQSREALTALCEAYWTPLYAFARRKGMAAEDAQDRTQSFFVMLLESDVLVRADPSRGRFRTYLLTVFQRFLINQHQYDQALKRGGGRPHVSLSFEAAEREYQRDPGHALTAERLYEKRWALTLLDRVLDKLREKYAAKGRGEWFDALQPFLAGAEAADEELAETAERLGLSTGAARVATHRLRKQYRELLRHEVAQTLADDGDVDAELTTLMQALRGDDELGRP
jgi:RNA polymerase sigma-70 factor (ECF subfamily)